MKQAGELKKEASTLGWPWAGALSRSLRLHEPSELAKLAKSASAVDVALGLDACEELARDKKARGPALSATLFELGKAAARLGGIETVRSKPRGKRHPQGMSAWDMAMEFLDEHSVLGLASSWAAQGVAPWEGWKKLAQWKRAYPQEADRMLDPGSAAQEMALAWMERKTVSGLESLGNFCAKNPSAQEAAAVGFERAREQFERRLADWSLDGPRLGDFRWIKEALVSGFGRARGAQMIAPWEQAARQAFEQRQIADGWLGACACAFESDNAALARIALEGALALDPRCARRAGSRKTYSDQPVEGLWSMAARARAWDCCLALAGAGAWIGAWPSKEGINREATELLASLRDQAAMGGERKELARQALEAAGRRVVAELEMGGMAREEAVAATEKASLWARRAVGAKRASEKERLAMGFSLALSDEPAPKATRSGPRL